MTSRTPRHPEPRPSRRVASLLDAAAAPDAGPVSGEQEALAAFRSGRRRVRSLHPRSFAAALAASATTAVLVTGGVSAAVPGSVSDAARETAGHVLRTFGIYVPTATPSGDTPSGGESQSSPGSAQPTVGDGAPVQGAPTAGGHALEPTIPSHVDVGEGARVAERTNPTPDSQVVEQGSADAEPTATPTDDPSGVEQGSASPEPTATPTEDPSVVEEGSASPEPTATPTDDPSAVEGDGGLPLPPALPSDVPGVVEDGAGLLTPAPTIEDQGVGRRGRADEVRSGDGNRTAEAGGAGDAGDDGSPVEPGKSTDRGHRR